MKQQDQWLDEHLKHASITGAFINGFGWGCAFMGGAVILFAWLGWIAL